jgi:hypothetical protein
MWIGLGCDLGGEALSLETARGGAGPLRQERASAVSPLGRLAISERLMQGMRRRSERDDVGSRVCALAFAIKDMVMISSCIRLGRPFLPPTPHNHYQKRGIPLVL